MKNFRKITALLIALVMVFALAVPAFAAAADGDTATADDFKAVTVTGAEDATAVDAYKLITADYSGTGGKWTGKYVWAPGIYTPAEGTTAASGILIDAGFTAAQIEDLWTAMTTSAQTIDAADVAKIASAFAANERKVAPAKNEDVVKTSLTKSGNNWTANLGAGQYVILATGGNSTIYNPMVVAAAYNPEENVAAPGWADGTGTVSGGSAYTLPEDGVVTAKKTTVTANKKQLGAESYYLQPITEEEAEGLTNVLDENGKPWTSGQRYIAKDYELSVNNEGGDDVQFGDIIDFELTATIPSYNTEIYKNPHFSVSDTLEADCFEGLGNIVVKVDGKTLNEGTDYTLTPSTLTNTFKVLLDPAVINANLGKDVVVTYQAKLTKEGANVNYDANNNKMVVEYSNNPNQDFSTQPEEGDEDILDFTNTYTFEVDFLKTNEKNDGEEGYETLKGAEFKLYRDPQCTILVDTQTSADEDTTTTEKEKGTFSFKALNAGTYYLKETKAPDGYQANDTVYKIVIEADYGDDPTDTKTEIKFDKLNTETGFYETADGETSYTDPDGNVYKDFTKPTTVHTHTFVLKSVTVTMDSQTVNIGTDGQDKELVVKNTKMTSLPSTGGMGTYIFTVVGVALLAVACFMLIFKRRKAEK